MSEERKAILKMVEEGTISPEEANQLLETLEKDSYVEGEIFNNDDINGKKLKRVINLGEDSFKDGMSKLKENLSKTKDKLEEEFNNINTDDIKNKIKVGYKKLDEAMKKVDDAILKFTKDIENKFKSKE